MSCICVVVKMWFWWDGSSSPSLRTFAQLQRNLEQRNDYMSLARKHLIVRVQRANLLSVSQTNLPPHIRTAIVLRIMLSAVYASEKRIGDTSPCYDGIHKATSVQEMYACVVQLLFLLLGRVSRCFWCSRCIAQCSRSRQVQKITHSQTRTTTGEAIY